MAAITPLNLADLKEFYTVTDSITQDRINTLTAYVKNITFLAMFGLKITGEIFDGTIADNAGDTFIGFKKFIALCIVAQILEDAHVHTNIGLKIVGGPNLQSPGAKDKIHNAPLNRITAALELQLVEAKNILRANGSTPADKFASYGSFRIDKV